MANFTGTAGNDNLVGTSASDDFGVDGKHINAFDIDNFGIPG